ncbi:MAG: GyrI-like domain-containing protein [Colwellia sp.]|nr:GyrI-like domain-containing protein [Colwellia sp.]
MEKIDLYKLHKADYIQPKEPVLIKIPTAHYLKIDGTGAPGSTTFDAAVMALYAMAYTIKMTRKKHGKGDYVICKLEARYWSPTEQCLSEIDKSQWQWQLMIRTPSIVAVSDLTQAADALAAKGKTPSVHQVKMNEFEFSNCVQMLHVGAYEDEHYTIKKMLDFANKKNLTAKREHCEVYISDPRRVPAERLKTILRMPVS